MSTHIYKRNILAVITPVMLVTALATGSMPSDAMAEPTGYSFSPLAELGDPVPGDPTGGLFINDFEPGGINNRGDVVFGADVTTGGEGVFFLKKGQTLSQLARSLNAAPGGGSFGNVLFLGPTTLNDQGDTAFAFDLDPFEFPVGANSGVYRRSHSTGVVTPVVRPGVTHAPGGGEFVGGYFGPNLNNGGDLVFPAIIHTEDGIHVTGEAYTGLGIGIFKADKKDHISSVVSPGDPAPGGKTFDFASSPWSNDGGDVAFSAHVVGAPCTADGFAPQELFIGCLPNLYVKKAGTGEIKSIVLAGETAAPGGGTFRAAGSPVMNNQGDIVFLGDLTEAPDANKIIGVYLYSQGKIIRVAGPGDVMPGGGKFVTASALSGNQLHVNNSGEVVFTAGLDTTTNTGDIPDIGLYAWSRGKLRLVARPGTVIPGVGTIHNLSMAVITFPVPTDLILSNVINSGAINNDRGQVVFGATLESVTQPRPGVMLLATPTNKQ